MLNPKQLEDFRAAVEAVEKADLIRLCGSTRGNEHSFITTVRPKRKYTNVDVGTSGKYMIENDTGLVFGIKGYGVIHRGKQYGDIEHATAICLASVEMGGLMSRYK